MKPGGQYRKGYRLERRTMELLESVGYVAFRMAGSHGLFDVIGISPAGIVLAQVKSGKASLSPADEEAIRQFRAPTNASKVLIRWRDRVRKPEVREF